MSRPRTAALRTAALRTTALLGLTTFALAATTYTVQWQGKTIPGSAIIQNGRTYVSADALKAAGIAVNVKGNVVSLAPIGGANQVAAVEGCTNDQLFNGVWRFKVLDVTGGGDTWRARVELRNGATVGGYSLSGSGLGSVGLQLDTGKTLDAASFLDLSDHAFLPGEARTGTVDFPTNAATGKPVKLVLTLDPQGVANTPLKYTVKDPSFRVNLTCRK